MTEQPKNVSDETRRDAGLSDPDLWLRYFELGGMRTPAEVNSFLHRGVVPSAHDHDVLAQALNERFSDLARDNSVQYAEPPPLTEPSPLSLVRSGVQIGLLGAFTMRINEEPVRLPRNAQRVVCFLALHDGMLLRQHVAGSLWPDTTDRRAAGSLRSALWRLGSHTHPVVEVAGTHIRRSPSVAVDVHACEALARRALDDSQDLREPDLDTALLSADLLPGWTEDWVIVRREHHTQLRLRALESLCRRLSEMGRFGQAVHAGMLAVSVEPLRESAQRGLIKAHLAQRNVDAAVKQYHSFRKLLHSELQLEPSAELRKLVKGLLD